MIGAIGLAALIHPERLRFLKSPAPWVAIAALVIAMIPHLIWLKEVDFIPLTYAGDVYGLQSRTQNIQLVIGYVLHNAGLLAVPVGAGVAGAGVQPDHAAAAVRDLCTHLVARPNPGVNFFAGAQCLDDPDYRCHRPAARRAGLHGLYEDRLGHLAVLPDAAGAGRDPGAARAEGSAVQYCRDLARDHAFGAVRLALDRGEGDGDLSEQFFDLWRALRTGARADASLALALRHALGRVAGTTEMGEPLAFYSPDHPAPYTPGEVWSSGLTSLEEAKRLGFIGVCDATDGRLPVCEAWMKENGKDFEQLAITTQRFFRGHPGPSITWKVFIVPPAK